MTVRAYLLLDAATASSGGGDGDQESSGLAEMLAGDGVGSASLSDAMLVSGATATLPSMVQVSMHAVLR